MQTIIQTLTGVVSDAFARCGYGTAYGGVIASDRLDLCQFQCNDAFAAAKVYKKNPFTIAGEVAAALREDPMFLSAEAARPGFINLSLSDATLLSVLGALARDPHLGVPQAEEAETIVLDYGGPNVAKPLHIGHLRPAVIGEALKRIARAAGHRVISDVHFGDWGLPIGLIFAELQERHPEWACFSPDFDPETGVLPEISVEMLNEVYPLASARSKEDQAFLEKARAVTFALQNGHPGCTALWKEVMRVSVADVRAVYGRLGVDFDVWYGESDSQGYIEPMIRELTARGLLRESDGARVVDVAEECDTAPMPPVIVVKSDGAYGYATTDLATLCQRQQDFAPNRVWYVTDKRQSLHFTQVFRALKKAGLVPRETELAHLPNGTMNGPDGKPFKTRDGGVMRLSDLLDTVARAALDKLRSSEYAAADAKEATAEKIGVAALKFGDLINHRSKDYTFDLDKFLSFEGKTGTYLLYTVTRIHSILKKAGAGPDGGDVCPLHGIYTDIERSLILALLQSGEAYLLALREKAPNAVCESAYRIAAAFSAFYHDNSIVAETDAAKKETWLSLCCITSAVLRRHLDALGIEAVESM